jgi:ribose 5-phosphate isomerase B
MKVGMAADHGGYEMKQKIYILLCARGHQVVDFGNLLYDRDDDYPDFAIPLARAVAAGVVEQGVLLCGSGIGASIAANKIEGVRVAVCHDDFSGRQGVEDDDMNILCLGGLTTGVASCLELRKKFPCREVQWSGTAPSSPCQSQCDSHQSDCCLRRSDGSLASEVSGPTPKEQ